MSSSLSNYLLSLADDEFILGHRNSEWCGHAPILEEDIAFANLAQDELGHARLWYEHLCNGTAQTPDRLVFFRAVADWRNAQLLELPKGDWALSMMRQYLFDALEMVRLPLLAQSADAQVAAIAALEGDQQCVRDIAEQYRQRRNVLVKGLHELGWMVENPKASMYVWAKIPEAYAHLGSLEFAKKLLAEAKVCVSPGVGFGEYGDDHVRFALIENQDRIRQAVRGIRGMFRADGLINKPGA